MIDNLKPGCILDYSHDSARDLNLAIINYAEKEFGFNPVPFTAEELADDSLLREVVWFESEKALDYMNNKLGNSKLFFMIEDNSLYLDAGSDD